MSQPPDSGNEPDTAPHVTGDKSVETRSVGRTPAPPPRAVPDPAEDEGAPRLQSLDLKTLVTLVGFLLSPLIPFANGTFGYTGLCVLQLGIAVMICSTLISKGYRSKADLGTIALLTVCCLTIMGIGNAMGVIGQRQSKATPAPTAAAPTATVQAASATPMMVAQGTQPAQPPSLTPPPTATPSPQPTMTSTPAAPPRSPTATASPSPTPIPPSPTPSPIPLPSATPSRTPALAALPTAIPTAVPPATSTPVVIGQPFLQSPPDGYDTTATSIMFSWSAPPSGLPTWARYEVMVGYRRGGVSSEDTLARTADTSASADPGFLTARQADDNRFWWFVRVVDGDGNAIANTASGPRNFIWKGNAPLPPTATPVPPTSTPVQRPTNTPPKP